MSTEFAVLGLGDLIFDHVFVERDGELVYSHGSGGGSVFNILVNLAAHRAGTVRAMGAGGLDVFGNAAVEELALSGVDTSGIILVQKPTTQIVFEEVLKERRGESTELHRFKLECPVCNVQAKQRSWAKAWKSPPSADLQGDFTFVCADRISPYRVDIARRFRDRSVATVLDLGRLGFIRYRPIAEVVSALRAFSIVLCPERVARALVRRTGVAEMSDLLRLGIDVLLVSMGSRGLRLIGRREQKIMEELLTPPDCHNIVDDSGAGDALLADFVFRLGQRSGPMDLKTIPWEDLVNVAIDAANAVRPVLFALGARGHLQSSLRARKRIPTDSCSELAVSEIRARIDVSHRCPFCGATGEQTPEVKVRTKVAYGARRNVQIMQSRVLFAAEHVEAVSRCCDLLRTEGTGYTIGTGGSFAVAEFCATTLNVHGRSFSRPVRPFEYCRMGKQSDYAVVITYSGASADCEQAIQKAKNLGVGRIFLLTGSPDPPIAGLLRPVQDTVICYGRGHAQRGPARERGFVSIAGTVSPCAVITAAVTGQLEMTLLADKLRELEKARCGLDADTSCELLIGRSREFARVLRDARFVAVFGGGWSWPAVVDYESKVVEAGLTVAQIHEVKDFSHGRFMSLLTEHSTPALFIGVPPILPYEEELLRTVSKDRMVLSVVATTQGIVGALEVLATMQYVLEVSGDELNRDISRPGRAIPDAGLRLYRWRDTES